jgi:dienelactone hydrolase
MRAAILLLCLMTIGVGARAQELDGERVEFPVRTASGTETIFGYLYLPVAAGAKAPAVVVVHGSGGVRNQNQGYWGRELSAFGFAVLAPDSFTTRGIASTVDDQSRLGTLQMVRDAFGALAFLARHPAVDGARVAIMGMSKGGSVVLSAADERIHKNAGFAAFIPLYPGCTIQYRNPRIKGPLLALIGAEDDYTGVKSCADYVERIRAAGGSADLKIYPDARHGFDGDTSARSVWLGNAQNYRDCVIYLEDDGRAIEAKSGETLDFANPRRVVEQLGRTCLKWGATVGANGRAKLQATEDVKAFLKARLMP